MKCAQAAEELGVSRNTLLRWFREGRIGDVPRDHRGWRVFRSSDIDRIRRELGEETESVPGSPRVLRMRAYLKRVPPFQRLSEPLLDELGDCARFRGMLTGQSLFMPGDQASGLHIVLKGKIRLYRSTPDGREQTLALLRPYQTLGEAEVFRTTRQHSSHAVCQVSSTVLTLPLHRVRELTRTHSALAFAFLSEFAGRIEHLEERLEQLALLSLEQRLARFLLDWADQNPTFTLSMTATELASLLGVTRESLSRALARFEREGLLRRQGQEMSLLNLQRLASL